MKKILLIVFTLTTLSHAEPEAAIQEPAKPEIIEVANTEKLKTLLDKDITVSGSPNATSNISKTGHFFYNFDHSEMIVFCFSAGAATFPEDKKPAALVGKKILVTGKLTQYKEKLQIAIRKPEQIYIIDAAAPPAESTKPAETKPAESDSGKAPGAAVK